MGVRHCHFPGNPPPLGPGGVHVWLARLDPIPSGVSEFLSADERARAAGYKLPWVRDQFIAGRGVLRAILSWYHNVEPGSVPLVMSPDGKPHLAGSVSHPVQFNVSHSNGWGLTAVSTGPVGVDLEPVRVVDIAGGLVDRFFAVEERESFRALPEGKKGTGFLRGWTCKEAVLKAVGTGMRKIECCAVEMDPEKPPRVIRLDGGGDSEWEIESWTPLEGFLAAVAYRK